MKKPFPGSRAAKAIPLVLFVCLLVPFTTDLAFGHGGHGKPEIQYRVEPKNEIEAPNKTLIRMGDVKISRNDFFVYIRNVAAFQMRTDLLQRNFLLHYWVSEGLCRYYPFDINPFFQKFIGLEKFSGELKRQLNEWAISQAALFAKIRFFYRKARLAGLDKKPENVSCLDVFRWQVKTDFMEDFVSFSSVTPPTRDGVRNFVAELTPVQRADIHRYYRDPAKASSFQRKEGTKRWIKYRRNLLKKTPVNRAYEKIQCMHGPAKKTILEVNGRKITMEDFLGVYGPIPNDVNWNSIKNSRLARLTRACAMADEADRLGIIPQSAEDKVNLSKVLFLFAAQAVREFGQQTLNSPDRKVDFQVFRKICLYTNLLRFEEVFTKETENLPREKGLWIDEDYLRQVDWIVEPSYTLEQASYF